MIRKILARTGNYKFLSVLFTSLIIALLFLFGPANAITLGITDLSSSTPDEGTDVSFLAKADIHTNDRVPLTNFTITISNGDTCTFDLSGEALTDCDNLEIEDVSPVSGNYSNDTEGYGYGYGYDSDSGEYDYITENFSYGYTAVAGYGYNEFSDDINSGTDAEFVYNITWTTPAVDEATTYTIDFEAAADDGSTNAIFALKTPSTIEVQDVPAEENNNGGGGGGGGALTYTATDAQLAEGYTNALGLNGQIKFTSGGGQHTLKITGLTASTATITLSSTPQTKTLSIGEVWKAELTGDDYYDVYVKLNSIASNKANVTIKSINEKITAETPATTGNAVDTGNEGNPTESAEVSSSKAWLWILVIVIIAVLIAGAIYWTKVKKNNYFNPVIFGI